MPFPSVQPPKKPTLSITEVVRSEKALIARRKAMWGDWLAECAGKTGQRESIIERILTELPSAAG